MTFKIPAEDFFINAPFNQLEDGLLDIFLEHRLQPEIGLEGNLLYDRSKEDFAVIAHQLEAKKLSCTLHAPFFDLSPGALDPRIRKATRQKLRLAFELIPLFKPRVIVCHLSFEDNKHGYKQDEWFEHAKKTWSDLLLLAAENKTTLMLENTYETSPKQHLKMLAELDSPFAKFCFDTGHVLAFAKNNWADWRPMLTSKLGHLHIHDNNGDIDSHLAPGRGSFDFAGLFSWLGEQNLTPTMTIEPHSLSDLWASLEKLKQMEVLD